MKDIDLKIQISARSDALLGKYIAHNLSSQPAFLFDILHGEASNSGSFELFESRVYVEIGQNRVTLSRKIMPVPPMTFVEKRNVPFVTRILPGETAEGDFILKLPAVSYSPYIRETEANSPLKKLSIVFELGFFLGKEGTEALAKRYKTSAGLRYGFDPFPITSQKTVSVELPTEIDAVQ